VLKWYNCRRRATSENKPTMPLETLEKFWHGGGAAECAQGRTGSFFRLSDARNPHFCVLQGRSNRDIRTTFFPRARWLLIPKWAASGGAPGRIAELTGNCTSWRIISANYVFREFRRAPVTDSTRRASLRGGLKRNETEEFILPTSTLTGSGGPELRGSIRIWKNYRKVNLQYDQPHVA